MSYKILNSKVLSIYNFISFILSLFFIYIFSYLDGFNFDLISTFGFYLIISELIFFITDTIIKKIYTNNNNNDIIIKFYTLHRYYFLILAFFIFILTIKKLNLFNLLLFFVLGFFITLFSNHFGKHLSFNVKSKAERKLMTNIDFYYCCTFYIQSSLLSLLYLIFI